MSTVDDIRGLKVKYRSLRCSYLGDEQTCGIGAALDRRERRT